MPATLAMPDTQDECRKVFLKAAEAFIQAIDEVDRATPWSVQEPSWWLDMVSLRQAVHKARNRHRKDTDT